MDVKNMLLYEAAIAAICVIASSLILKTNRRKQRAWSRKWLQRREEGKDVLNMLNNELLIEDPWSYTNFLRLNHSQFESLLSSIKDEIAKQDTVMRECIPARTKLEVTLRFLGTGETYRSLMYSTRIHETTISRFVPEVCKAITNSLKPKYLKFPQTAAEWQKIADDFWNLWHFPHCLGALDGKHIAFRAPISDGSYYYNYKGGHSIVLLGLVDAKYRFTYANIGVNGRNSDGGVFSHSNLAHAIHNNSAHFPPPEIVPGLNDELPYVIVADEAFPLMTNIMKPYSGRELSREIRIFNYRLSRARRMVESAFGILSNRFRILLNPISLNAEKVQLITLTCVLLHNFLTTENAGLYAELNDVGQQKLSGLSRQSIIDPPHLQGRFVTSLRNFSTVRLVWYLGKKVQWNHQHLIVLNTVPECIM